MKKTSIVIGAIILLGGIIHIGIGLSPLISGELSLDNLWFTSAGLTLLFNVFINYLVCASKSRTAWFLAIGHVTNILSVGLMLAVFNFLRAPHVALLLLLLIVEMVLLIFWHRKQTRSAL